MEALAETAVAVPSRAELQRWIEHGRVTVDGRSCKPADKVRPGSKLHVVPEPPPRTDAVAEDGIAFDVLYTDDDVVVLVKPAGLVVHPARGHEGGTLVNGLLALGLFKDGAWDGDEDAHLRPGIVHRLDKGTSGVMIVARNAHAREHLKAQFSAHSIERAYEAICVGTVKARTFDTLHGRHATERLKFTTHVKTGKRAVTHVRPIEALLGATHVECRLETGRTHQIRVHLAEAGHAILGDPLYGRAPPGARLKEVAARLGHQALHARVLGFVHPTSAKAMRFESPPPADFVMALAALR
ncbi:MAG: Ribosomal large subunit pseudouridine synthase [Myxococcaceae bacterium]|nr:Ribosomal large subunit pseudouridine synthase [Myxococcaceae bacterium]